MQLSKGELEIMELLWMQNRPLVRGELISYLPDKSWKDASVHLLINSLLDKGVIRSTGVVKCAKTSGRTYANTISVEEYYIDGPWGRFKDDPLRLVKVAIMALCPNEEQLQEALDILHKHQEAD